jgi:hypothetical protein
MVLENSTPFFFLSLFGQHSALSATGSHLQQKEQENSLRHFRTILDVNTESNPNGIGSAANATTK